VQLKAEERRLEVEQFARKQLVAELLQGLGRPVTALDRVHAFAIASHHVTALRLEGDRGSTPVKSVTGSISP
jgi:hypothetical protein